MIGKGSSSSSSASTAMSAEERELLESLGIDSSLVDECEREGEGDGKAAWSSPRPIVRSIAWAGVGAALAANVAILLSLPPVLRGRGAPFLPSQMANVDSMFRWLRQQPEIKALLLPAKHADPSAAPSSPNQTPRCDRGTGPARLLKFVDLGSGDGRWVFRAARHHPDLFDRAVGYEINPLLHAWASLKRLVWGSVRPEVLSATSFRRQDLWSVPLRDADVVAVYGLGPIMKELGAKLQRELPAGSYVLSNVFEIPGWQPSVVSASSLTTTSSSTVPSLLSTIRTSSSSSSTSTIGVGTYYIYKLPQPPPPPAASSAQQ